MFRPNKCVFRHHLLVMRPHIPHIEYGILLIPPTQLWEVPALLCDAKLSKRHLVLLYPTVRHNIDIAAARDALQDHVQAVAHVHHVHVIGFPIGEFLPVVVVEVHLLADCVEAVNLVEDVDLDWEKVVVVGLRADRVWGGRALGPR